MGTEAERVLQAALARFQAGQHDQAILELQGIAEDDPLYPRGRVLLGNVHLAARRMGEAEAAYRAAVAADPARPEAWNNLGNVLALGGRPDEARDAFARALEGDPGYSDALLNLATLTKAAGDVAGAEGLIRRAVDSAPGNELVLAAFARHMVEAGRAADALATLTELATAHPQVSAPHATIGGLKAQAGDLEGAMLAAKAALDLSPESASAHALLGDCLLRSSRAQEAGVHLERAHAAAPEDVGIITNLGVAAAGAGDIKLARGAVGRALELRSDYLPASFNLSRLCWRAGDRDGAVVVARAAVRASGGQREAHLFLVDLLFQAGRLDDARAAAAAATVALPEDVEVLNLLGIVQQAGGELGEAAGTFQSVLERSPGHLAAAMNLAQTHLQGGAPAAAADALGPALAAHPGSSHGHALLAESQRLLGKLELAQESFARAAELDPHNLFAWDGLVGLHQAAGDTAAMVRACRAARAANAEIDRGLYPNLGAVDLD